MTPDPRNHIFLRSEIRDAIIAAGLVMAMLVAALLATLAGRVK